MVAGIVRTYTVWQTLVTTYDETWYGYDTWLWTSVESELAIICACAPALKPFFKRYLGGSTESAYPGNTTLDNNRNRALDHSRDDIEIGLTTEYVAEISKNRIPIGNKDYAGKNTVLVTTELSVVGRRVSDASEDGDSLHNGYTSSVASMRELSRPSEL